MRTISTTVYKFHELSEEAQKKAIEDTREEMLEHESRQAIRWAIDDCSLLEPPHEEMVRLFGADYYQKNGGRFMIKNLRKGIHWNGEVYDDYGDVMLSESSLEITDSKMFLIWLGIPEKFVDRFDYFFDSEYSITPDSGLEIEYLCKGLDNPIDSIMESIIVSAKKKWKEHLENVGTNIAIGVQCYFEEDMVIDRIESEEEEYLEDGTLAKSAKAENFLIF